MESQLNMATFCPNCGSENRDAAQFCKQCASPLTVELICANCRAKNRPNSRFCLRCGTPLRGSTPPAGLTGQLPANALLNSRYLIVGRIGRGGMAAVYQATDTRLSNKVWAIKEMSDAALLDPGERQQARAAFQREAQMLARLNHLNLPKVNDFFEEGGKLYLVMDYIEGQTLEEVLDTRFGGLPESRVLDWARQLCDVLDYLHHCSPPIIFRDLKPGNIMLERSTCIKLIDFGVARWFKPGQAQDTISFGTDGYAPPEQYGKGQTDARSDIYALGVTLHQLLTCHDPASTLFALPPARRVNPAVSVQVEQALIKATQADRVNRYQSVAEFRQSLLATSVQANYRPQPVPPPTVRTKHPTRWLAWAVILIVAAVVIVAGSSIWPISPSPVTPVAGPSALITPTVSITPTVTPLPPQLISRVVEGDLYRIFLPVLARNDKPRTAAQVRATATAQAKASATQAAKMAATAQARTDWCSKIRARLNRVYGPETDQLAPPATADAITLHAAGSDEYDVVIKATFTNPYAATEGAWSYGFFFRQTGPNDAYQLIVRSDGGWRLIDRTDTQTRFVAWGSVPNLRVTATGANTVEVLTKDGYGQLWVNDVFVAELNLTARTKPGDVSIATGFYAGDGLPTAMTRYGNFTVWTLR
jgi:serine/threonine protein kinase, bacterial